MSRGNFIYKRLGEKILHYRKKKGFSQNQLALISDIDRSYIGKLEQGKANPTFTILIKLSKGLKTKLSRLLKGV